MNKVLVGIFCLLFILTACAQKAEIESAPIKVGAILALTGSNSLYGEQAKRGVELAVEDVNKDGINGRLLEVVYEDSKGQGKEAVSAFNKLRIQDINVFLTLTSGVALSIAPLANQEGVLQMEMGATTPKYATPNDYTFRTAVNARFFAEVLAKELISRNINQVAVLYINTEWGLGLIKAFEDKFHQLGGNIELKETFDEGATDFRTQLEKIKQASSQNIVLVSLLPETGRLLKQASELSLNKQLYSDVFSVEGQTVLDVAGQSADGIMYVAPKFDTESKEPVVEEFVKAYQAKYDNAQPSALEAQAYDAVHILAQAMQSCAENAACLKNKLSVLSHYAGASGDITFDENGDPIDKVMQLKTINNGRFVSVNAQQSIKIGAILPLSGDDSFWGENARNGIQLAVEDVNRKGGINLEVVFEDGKCDPKSSVTAMQKLVEIDGVKAVVGEVCSSATLAIAPIAQNNKVILIAPCSESPAISDAGDYVFRTWTPNNRQARVMAKYARESGISKIAVLNIDNDFGNSLAKAFVEEFETVVFSDKYGKEDQDFRTLLTKIKASNPDAVYLVSYQKDGIAVIRQMSELGIKAKILATSGINSVDSFFKPLGELAEGIVFSDLKDSTTEEFRTRYAQKYGKEWPGVGSCAGVSYDAVALIAAGIKQGDVKGFLAGVRDFPGVSGPITFDANGDLDREHAIFIVKDGRPVLV